MCETRCVSLPHINECLVPQLCSAAVAQAAAVGESSASDEFSALNIA